MKKRSPEDMPCRSMRKSTSRPGAGSPLRYSRDYFKKYVGGKCLAARLLLDLTEPGLGPLSERAVIIINTGPLNGTGAPSSSRFNLSFKNVMTGGIASSNCGGQFGVMLKRAGFDGLIITGRARSRASWRYSTARYALGPRRSSGAWTRKRRRSASRNGTENW